MREKVIETKLRRFCSKNGLLCLKLQNAGNAGMPDRIVMSPQGRAVFVEVKTLDGRVSPVQRERFALLERAGYKVLIFRGEDEDYNNIVNSLQLCEDCVKL